MTMTLPGTRRATAARRGLATAVVLMVLAMAVPAVTGWYVHVHSFPPLHADVGATGGLGHGAGPAARRAGRAARRGALGVAVLAPPAAGPFARRPGLDAGTGVRGRVARHLADPGPAVRVPPHRPQHDGPARAPAGVRQPDPLRGRSAALAGARRRPPARSPDVLRGPRPGRAGQRVRRRDRGDVDRGDDRGRGAGHRTRPRRRDPRAPGRALPGARPGRGLAVGLRRRDVRGHGRVGGRLPRARGAAAASAGPSSPGCCWATA